LTVTGFIYLASPYSHPDAAVREQRYLDVCRATAALMRAGHVVFSPIAHSHPIEVSGMGETLSGAFWKRQDIPLLRHAARLAVLMLPGWEQSEGIKWEIETAEALDIPVDFLDPEAPALCVEFDLVKHLDRQRRFSLKTFGPGLRTGTVIDHIRKELIEVADSPADLMEWVDVILLALDGANRTGVHPGAIAAAIAAKQTRNEARTWPDWRTVPDGQAIEHVREGS
jgi:hypothetical protein